MQAELTELAQRLIDEKRVAFFCIAANRSAWDGRVSVWESEEWEYREYEQEYEPGAMFGVGPPLPTDRLQDTSLRFGTMQEAGNAVLKQRAQMLGLPWGGDA